MTKKNDRIEAIYPLSPMQQGMLFHTLYEPGSGVYIEQVSCMFRGDLDVVAFQRAWQQVVDRHPTLRTAFIWEQRDEPFQVVYRQITLPWQYHDWRNASDAEQAARLRDFLVADRAGGFVLSSAPLTRVALIQTSAEGYHFVWSHHHLVLDGWSVSMVLKEVFASYAAFAHGRSLDLPRRRPYRDYIAWLQRQDRAQAETFWRQFLRGVTAPTPLGVDQQAEPDWTGAEHFAVRQQRLPEAATKALQAFTRQHALTLNTLVQGAWAMLLSRYSGQDDVIFGVTVAGRPPDLPGSEAMVGLFINTLPVRIVVPPRGHVLPWLAQLQDQQAELRQYEYSALVQVQGWSDMPRGLPLFECILVFENYPLEAVTREPGRQPALAIRDIQAVEWTNYPLTVEVEPGPSLLLRISYDCHRFDDATITRLLGHYATLLAALVAQPDTRLAAQPLLSAVEREQLLVGWNPPLAAPPLLGLHQLVAAQAARTPDAIALVADFRDKETRRQGDWEITDRTTNDGSAFSLQPSAFSLQLTYRELNARATRLAALLQAHGVGADVPVGLYLPRSLDLFVALLAVLQAGGAYLPLDPAYPSARLTFMLEDAHALLLLTDAAGAAKLTPPPSVRWLDPTRLPDAPDAPPVRQAAFQPMQLAALFYTSGSTGTPKGVGLSHQALTSYLAALAPHVDLRTDDRVLQFAPISFDVLVEEVFPTWTAGAALVLRPDALPAAGRELTTLLEAMQITVVELTTAYWAAWVAELAANELAAPRALRLLLMGGERVAATSLLDWQRLGRALLHVYGLTETGVTTTVEPLVVDANVAQTLPIGKPIGNTQVYVLDRALEPVPVGVVGELYIGGAGLARGYLGRPALTAERFVPNPFARTIDVETQYFASLPVQNIAPVQTQNIASLPHYHSMRLYRTGDRVRYQADGRLMFVGRGDTQVKLRGYRIELGEVAAALEAHPDVQACAALIWSAADTPDRLVAYVVPQQGSGVREQGLGVDEGRKTKDEGADADSSIVHRPSSFVIDLRSFLQTRLPEYMLPSAFVLLDALPLTPNGKLDRKALPAPEPVDEATLADELPLSPMQTVVASLFATVLGTTSVGRQSHFFALGGHSLLATQLIARVRTACAVELPLRAVFEYPTVAALAEQIETARRTAQGVTRPPIRPVRRDAPLPLSFAQQRLWFLDQLQPGSPAYNVPTAVRLLGPLDRAALADSLHRVVRRHEVLRTTFALHDGQPVQQIGPPSPPPLPLLDLRALPPDTRDALARQLAEQETQRPFDLARGPLLRAQLLQLADDAHLALLTMHHCVSDAWSAAILLRELSLGYAAARRGHAAPLPELPIQYADYAVWQRAWLQGALLDTQRHYWQQHLTGVAALDLPLDQPRAAVQSTRGASQRVRVPEAVHAGLQALSRRAGTTLFMTVLAGFQLVLARYSGQTNIVVGTPIANRGQPECEGLIGFFLNTLVLRTDMAGDPSVRALLERVRAVCLAAYTHQELPFEQVVEDVQPTRDLSRHPLFQVVFLLEHASPAAPPLAELQLQPFPIANESVKFDLSLSLTEGANGLTGVLEYNRDLFAATTITRMVRHCLALLDGMVAQPDAPISRLPLLNQAERAQLLVEWNASATAYPRDACAHQLFEAQAAHTPDALALVYADAHLTYGVLNARANQLAHLLRQRGVGPDVRVGLCMEPALAMIIGLLGILKAGGAYVPLDPTYPPERLAFMLDDAQVRVLVTKDERRMTNDERSLSSFVLRRSSFVNLQVLDLRADRSLLARQPAAQPASAVQADNLAYVIYTSGSTGTPKGVQVAHRGLVNMVLAQLASFGVRSDSRVFQFASMSFDASVSELFMALAAGALLAIAAPNDRMPGSALAQLLHDQLITTITLPPAALAVIPIADLPALKTLIVAGEACPAELMARWAAGRSVFNAYGPTEATVCATIGPWNANGDPPAIGRAIANTQIYLLDAQLRPVPIGAYGEIYIGGVGLARGYLDRPDLTAERFVPNPFAKVSGIGYRVLGAGPSDTRYPIPATRLYKTGDLARFRPDGSIVFLGRSDTQVKLRGYRIELGEVAAALRAHPAVREAAVVAHADDIADMRLVAYVVMTNDRTDAISCVSTTNDAEPDPSIVHRPSSFVSELRSFIKERLPDYMLPSAFVLLDALPLTPNGKIDRRALPAPEQIRPELQETFVAPRTIIEEVLASILADVLQLDRVGVADNFFTLGGHSLLAARLIARINETFQIALPLRRVFETPTAADLAAYIERARQSSEAPQLALQPVLRDAPLPLSFAQQRLWFIDQLEPGSPAYNIPAAVRLSGAIEPGAFQRSLNGVIARHEVLRTTFPLLDGQPAQLISAPCPLTLPLIDLRALPDDRREALARELAQQEARRPFDLARGPLLRAALLQLTVDDQIVLLNMHHIVADAWSTGVLIREVAALYSSFTKGTAATLTPLPIQYADYAVWQRRWLQGEFLEMQLAYWRTQLADLPTLELPSDYPRPPIATSRGASCPLLLPPLHAELVALSRRAGTTLFMTLLASFQMLLARYTGQNDIVVGTPIAGRNHAETQALIGCFLNTLALRLDLSGDPTFQQVLGRVREVCLGAYAHQDVPFEQVVDALQPDRDLSRHPLFQVMFLLEHASRARVEMPDLLMRPLEVDQGTTHFDLSLTLSETSAGLVGALEYSTDLFERSTITRLLGHYATLLTALVAQPDTRLAAQPLLSAVEREQLLVGWNPPLAAPPLLGLHHLVAAQAARSPDAIALVYQTNDERRTTNLLHSSFVVRRSSSVVHLTYSELNARATRLAALLQSHGVGPDVPVGLYLPRSLDLFVALLAVLQAGGAYLPLDPAYPAARLTFMLEDAHAPLLLTDAAGAAKLTPPPSVRWLDPTRLPDALDMPPVRQAAFQPMQLAALFYTSGSTGTPKGVGLSHQALTSYLAALAPHLALQPHDRVLQFAPISFDVLVEEVFPTWTAGAALVLRPDALPAAGRELTTLLEAMQITVVELTTAYWAAWVAELAANELTAPRALRLLLMGGERVAATSLLDWQRLGRALLHVYGLTETGVTTTVELLVAGASVAQTLPIGKPIGNTQVYVLDRALEPVPVGVVGELYIGGAGLARGYLGRPALTAERFVPNPFAEVSGAGYRVSGAGISDTRYPAPDTRLYKTGDRVRYQADGRLAFVGRSDTQVKLRGYRIELGEVAAALEAHPAVQACAALIWSAADTPDRLVAYVVPQQESGSREQGSGVDEGRKTNDEGADSSSVLRPSSFVSDLRTFLQTRLPGYMLPSAFVLLDALPLTPNGKLDRKALPAPDTLAPDDSFVAPRTPVEQILAQIWAELLHLEHVGADDNFFALGGHSLLATQLIARVRTACAVELPLRAVFEYPTVAALAEQIETARRTAQGVTRPPIRLVRRDAPLPLSFAQQRLWFLDQLQPGSPAYNVPTAVRLLGPLDRAALADSLHQVVRRHEVLRTTFALHDGQPIQLIGPPNAPPLPLLDLRALPPDTRDALARQLAEQETQRPFDLARGPLLRAQLLQLADDAHLALLTMHHCVSDAWSSAILLRELSLGYAAARHGQPLPLPELPIQYADYAVWQRAWLQGALLDTQRHYWQQHLTGVAALDLPLDQPRAALQSTRGASQRVRVPPTVHTGLQALSRRAGTTLFMTVLAGFQLLLSRYSGQTDIVVGTPIANRGQPECEGLIGFFLNTLVLRTDVAGEPSVRALLERVRTVCLGAYTHQELPFEQVVEDVQPARDLSRHPLFQVVFLLEHATSAPPPLAEIQLQPFPLAGSTIKFDLTLSLTEDAQGLTGELEYNRDLFAATTITRMVRHCLALLDGMVAQPDAPISRLPLLNQAERAQLLVEWNASATAYPRDACAHQLFEAHAARMPDAIALVYADAHLTYAALNQRANQLAHLLRQRGVGPDVLVGLCVERSLEMLIGILGILKGGGAYVPLDPAYPPERLAFMQEDAQIAVLLVATKDEGRRTMDDLGESDTPIVNRKSKIVNLATDWPLIDQACAQNLPRVVDGQNLAYIIYTSGSTGRPKGVMVRQGGLINLCYGLRAFFNDRAVQSTGLITSISFDISVNQIFPTLLFGRTLQIIPEAVKLDSRLLLRCIVERHIQLLDGVPSYFQAALADHGPGRVRTALRYLLIGGEKLEPQLLQAVFAQLGPQVAIVNIYGLTEITDINAFAVLRASDAPQPIMIGRPLQNNQIYILDRYGSVQPIGVAGELCIAGESLSRGYLGRPELTAERFVPNPFADGDKETRRQGDKETRHAAEDRVQSAICNLQSAIGTRLCRTGDLGRRHANGMIELLGRIDQQIKLRGYRIELGEIAAALLEQPAVRECVVLVREDMPGKQRLVAYVVMTNDEGRTTNEIVSVETQYIASVPRPSSIVTELRAFLQTRLPDYMIPAAFVFLDALPKTPNGKIDRRALPQPDQLGGDREYPFVAPRSPEEAALARIWADVLGVAQVGVHDDFFALGGHSLLATQVIARVRNTFQIELPLRNLFETPTVADLAVLLVQRQAEQVGDDEMLALLAELDQLSEEEARLLLADDEL